MKKSIAVLLFLMVIIAGSFAETTETITLTGNIELFNNRHPVIKVNDVEYLLMIPHFFKIEDGDQITVTGEILDKTKLPPDCDIQDKNAELFRVEILTVNGKTYNIEEEFRVRGPRKGYGKHKGPKGECNGEGEKNRGWD